MIAYGGNFESLFYIYAIWWLKFKPDFDASPKKQEKQKQGKNVCKTTAVQCYQCFSLRSLLFLASRAKWLIPNKKKSYSDELLTAADRCKSGK